MPRLDLACDCGGVAWSIEESAPRRGIRYICHCDECQAYAAYLGRADTWLDENGGIDAYQLPASRVRIARGAELLAAVQVTPRPLLRWHCGRCRTPVAGTYHTAKLSFISLALPRGRESEVEEVLGPVLGHVWVKFARGDMSEGRRLSTPAILWRMLRRMVSARLTGDWRNNAFFHPEDGTPIAASRQLTPQERAELDAELAARI